ncbi:hypothetical protein KHM83_15420 [Fusibacter paucivorans]|uniref:Uncharacterized protein n=1 Tax=Fusibacter paucivorans TaxID=76009 RepID=A0ABS5PSD4_9FIRM|nr:hypothetical protein [Fusibacter paucivorans]MBS7528075.1 hypothetical protein [Fusibacter paucivorans]
MKMTKKIKQAIVLAIGIIISYIGINLNLSARDLAWPRSYSYSGARADTIWAITENVYHQIGLSLLIFGLLIILILIINWLWTSDSHQ